MSKIFKKFTEGNGQNLQFNFTIFFCFDVIKFLKPVFHGQFRGQQLEQREMHVFDNSRSIFSFEILGLTLFKKRLKDIHIAKK